MKVGDKVPVVLAGDVAGQAIVEAVDMDARQVTLVIPATRVVMGLRVSIDAAPAPVEQPSTQTIITGVDRYDADGNIIEGASTGDAGSAPVVEPVNSGNAPATETPTGEASQTGLVAPVPVEAPTLAPPVVDTPAEVVSSTPVEPANNE